MRQQATSTPANWKSSSSHHHRFWGIGRAKNKPDGIDKASAVGAAGSQEGKVHIVVLLSGRGDGPAFGCDEHDQEGINDVASSAASMFPRWASA
jgi:hypothetical protein